MSSCPISSQPDPFGKARRKDGVLVNEFEGKPVPMILRHEELRSAAKDWQTFSSDAPMHISQPPEVGVRTVRQLPLEIDPPEQTDYRAIAEPYFNRAKLSEVITVVEQLVRTLLESALGRESLEIVRDFAIPLQCRALAVLLNMPPAEADVWIGWGSHVFRSGDGKLHDDAKAKGLALEAYMGELLDRGAAQPGDDFFSALTRATFRGRPLTGEEMLGFGSIMFLGGRDTLINSVSGVVGYLARDARALEYLREDPKRIVGASEEFFRVISPVTHLTRVCPAGGDVHGVRVEPGGMASLCFASANYDESVFTSPEEVRLDRKPNPHVAFGFGPHLCLGAPHARLVVRSVLKGFCAQVGSIELIASQEKVEKESNYRRHVAYESLKVRMGEL